MCRAEEREIADSQARRAELREQGAVAVPSWNREQAKRDDPALKAARIHNQDLVSRLYMSNRISSQTANVMRRRYGTEAQRLRIATIKAMRATGDPYQGEMPDLCLTEDHVLAEDARLKLACGVEGGTNPVWHGELAILEGKKTAAEENEAEEAYNPNWDANEGANPDVEMGEAEEVVVEKTEMEIWSPYWWNQPRSSKWAE